MQTAQHKITVRAHRSGSAIVIILIIVAIIIVLNFLDIPSMFSGLPECENPVTSHDILPWQEESRLVGIEGQIENQTSSEQPDISAGVFLEAGIKESKAARSMVIMINPDGTLSGGWTEDYNKGQQPKMNYVVNAEFSGNIDATNIYFDENGEDLSKLFLIAKGSIFVLSTNFDTGFIGRGTQDIYVSGWVNPDHSAIGKLIMLTGGKTYKVFNWKTAFKPKKRNAGIGR